MLQYNIQNIIPKFELLHENHTLKYIFKSHSCELLLHVGFEAAACYWHFVDVVWLFLFVSIYWWGGI
jgi:heme/copper-type cytochrome/quinol oxidase subunit 3